MDTGWNLCGFTFTSFWPVGYIDHGFGMNISYYQVKSIVLIRFCQNLFRKIQGLLLALWQSRFNMIVLSFLKQFSSAKEKSHKTTANTYQANDLTTIFKNILCWQFWLMIIQPRLLLEVQTKMIGTSHWIKAKAKCFALSPNILHWR